MNCFCFPRCIFIVEDTKYWDVHKAQLFTYETHHLGFGQAWCAICSSDGMNEVPWPDATYETHHSGSTAAAEVPWPDGMPGMPKIPKIPNGVFHMRIIVFYGCPNISGAFIFGGKGDTYPSSARFSNAMGHNRSHMSVTLAQIGFFHDNVLPSWLLCMSNIHATG